MINLILFTFFVAVFAGGFWCGKTFNSYSQMLHALKQELSSWLK